MYFYQVLTERNLPGFFLVYKSEQKITVGNVVFVIIRNKKWAGIIAKPILKPEQEITFKLEKIREIEEILPIQLTKNQLTFLRLLNQNTLNNPNNLLKAFLQSIKFVSKAEIKKIIEHQNENHKILEKNTLKPVNNKFKQNPDNLEFITDSDFTLRIRNIIRKEIKYQNSLFYTKKSDQQKSNSNFEQQTLAQIILLFSENKLLQKIQDQIFQEFKSNSQINFLTYASEYQKKSRQTAKSLILRQLADDYKKAKIEIICINRSGLFLPFQNPRHLIVVDESSNFFIQDKNSLYLDARDTSYLFLKAYQEFDTNLTFLSHFPSSRIAKKSLENNSFQTENNPNNLSYNSKSSEKVQSTLEYKSPSNQAISPALESQTQAQKSQIQVFVSEKKNKHDEILSWQVWNEIADEEG